MSTGILTAVAAVARPRRRYPARKAPTSRSTEARLSTFLQMRITMNQPRPHGPNQHRGCYGAHSSPAAGLASAAGRCCGDLRNALAAEIEVDGAYL